MCKLGYKYSTGLNAHVKTKHTVVNNPINSVDNLSVKSVTADVHIMDDADDADMYSTSEQASQKTKADNINHDTSEIKTIVEKIICEIINKVVYEEADNAIKAANKVPIVPDEGWTKNTTGDLACWLDNISVDLAPLECIACDKRFMNKGEMDEHDLRIHGVEEDRLDIIAKAVNQDDYNLLHRKHQKLIDRIVILTRANQNRMESLKENERLRQANEASENILQETYQKHQILEDTVKVKDMDLKSKEELITKMKENDANQKRSIRSLQELLGIEEEDDEDDEEDEWITEEARRHNRTQEKCKECDFSTNNPTTLKGHMTRHKSYICAQCNKTLRNEADLKNHNMSEHTPQSHNCDQCQKQFSSKHSLKQHINSQHPTNPPIGHSQWANNRNETRSLDYTCNQCESAFETQKDIREHKATQHKGQNFDGFEFITKTCHFFQQGRCNRVRCRFAHILPFQQQQQQQQDAEIECLRGNSCRFLAWGSCHYYHQGVGVQQPRQQQPPRQKQQHPRQQQMRKEHQPRQQQQSQQQQRQLQEPRQQQQQVQKLCHFQGKCWNQNCTFRHEDFTLSREFQENY